MLLNVIELKSLDADAVIKAVVGYFIVFMALVVLYALFFFLPKLIGLKLKKKVRKEGKLMETQEEIELSGEVNAAISMALYLHFNQYHDEESREMTIKRESRLYSPWSSKIYQVRNQFNRL